MKAPIHSVKHIVQKTVATVGLGALATVPIVRAVKSGAVANPYDVEEGSVIKAVFVEFWVTSDDAAQGSFVLSIEKLNENTPIMTYAESIALDSYANKKNIYYTSQGLVAPNVSNPTPVIRQWVKIPKGKQRFGLDDTLYMNISGIGNGAQYCGMAIYKEYS